MKIVSDVTEFYDQEATEYDSMRWCSDAGAYTDAVQKEIVRQLLGDLQGQKILEVGVGTGRFTQCLVEKEAQVTGVDISLSMLRRTKDVLTFNGSLMQTDGASLPMVSECYDGCLSVNVFSHLVNYESSLQEITRVLRPGGFLVVNFPNLWSFYLPAGAVVNIRGRAVRRDVFTRWYSFRSFRLACAQTGLSIKRVVGQVQLKEGIPISSLVSALKKLDKLSRNSVFRYFCPTLFIKVEKTGQS